MYTMDSYVYVASSFVLIMFSVVDTPYNIRPSPLACAELRCYVTGMHCPRPQPDKTDTYAASSPDMSLRGSAI